jgi:NTP pyrophosphatase (non-canonical NTP hydrolase)
MDISTIAKEIHQNARRHGWWDSFRPIPELLCLVHSEVSEALEAYRNDMADIEGFAEELADTVIRVFDMAEGLGIDIEYFILEKHKKNIERPFKHGGKAC